MNFASIDTYSNILKGLSGGQSQPKVEDLMNRSVGLSKADKQVLFDYIRSGEQQAKTKKEYITNVMLIFNSFFEYGFLRGKDTSSSMANSSCTEEWEQSGDSN